MTSLSRLSGASPDLGQRGQCRPARVPVSLRPSRARSITDLPPLAFPYLPAEPLSLGSRDVDEAMKRPRRGRLSSPSDRCRAKGHKHGVCQITFIPHSSHWPAHSFYSKTNQKNRRRPLEKTSRQPVPPPVSTRVFFVDSLMEARIVRTTRAIWRSPFQAYVLMMYGVPFVTQG